MKKFVVGIANLYNGSVKLYKTEAEDKYNAFKRVLLDNCVDEPTLIKELEWQSSENFPKNWGELCESSAYEDFPFDIIEV